MRERASVRVCAQKRERAHEKERGMGVGVFERRTFFVLEYILIYILPVSLDAGSQHECGRSHCLRAPTSSLARRPSSQNSSRLSSSLTYYARVLCVSRRPVCCSVVKSVAVCCSLFSGVQRFDGILAQVCIEKDSRYHRRAPAVPTPLRGTHHKHVKRTHKLIFLTKSTTY